MKTYKEISHILSNTVNHLLLVSSQESFYSRRLCADESRGRVRKYSLPNPLLFQDGTFVTDSEDWPRRRSEIVGLFCRNVYGYSPSPPKETKYAVIALDDNALGGLATRKEIRVNLAGVHNDGPTMNLLIYIPNVLRTRGVKAPVFLGLNFFGNQTINGDPAITISDSWIPNNSLTKGRPPEKLRGMQSSSWPLGYILGKGYALATAYCGDMVPDRKDGLNLGIIKYFQQNLITKPRTESWGAISGWAWGLSRALDYLVHDEEIHKAKVIVMGHSRLGKAALWAGAQDERFAIVISNESGCGGAALARRRFGETVAEINSSFPHWFCDNFKRYSDNEDALPVDQHELLCLIAPRPLYVASAQLDFEADPAGEFLSLKHASPVYCLLDKDVFPARDLPPANMPIMSSVGYHIRKGAHGITVFDWSQFIRFADIHLSNS